MSGRSEAWWEVEAGESQEEQAGTEQVKTVVGIGSACRGDNISRGTECEIAISSDAQD